MKKKGFTLIELLAVIVVLAVIALIAVPIVLNLVNTAKKGAAEASAIAFVKEVDTYILLTQMNPELPKLENGETYQISRTKYEEFAFIDLFVDKVYAEENEEEIYLNEIIDMKGTKPTSGTVTIYGNKVSEAKFITNGYNVSCIGDTCEAKGKSNIKEEEKVIPTEKWQILLDMVDVEFSKYKSFEESLLVPYVVFQISSNNDAFEYLVSDNELFTKYLESKYSGYYMYNNYQIVEPILQGSSQALSIMKASSQYVSTSQSFTNSSIQGTSADKYYFYDKEALLMRVYQIETSTGKRFDVSEGGNIYIKSFLTSPNIMILDKEYINKFVSNIGVSHSTHNRTIYVEYFKINFPETLTWQEIIELIGIDSRKYDSFYKALNSSSYKKIMNNRFLKEYVENDASLTKDVELFLVEQARRDWEKILNSVNINLNDFATMDESLTYYTASKICSNSDLFNDVILSETDLFKWFINSPNARVAMYVNYDVVQAVLKSSAKAIDVLKANSQYVSAKQTFTDSSIKGTSADKYYFYDKEALLMRVYQTEYTGKEFSASEGGNLYVKSFISSPNIMSYTGTNKSYINKFVSNIGVSHSTYNKSIYVEYFKTDIPDEFTWQEILDLAGVDSSKYDSFYKALNKSNYEKIMGNKFVREYIENDNSLSNDVETYLMDEIRKDWKKILSSININLNDSTTLDESLTYDIASQICSNSNLFNNAISAESNLFKWFIENKNARLAMYDNYEIIEPILQNSTKAISIMKASSQYVSTNKPFTTYESLVGTSADKYYFYDKKALLMRIYQIETSSGKEFSVSEGGTLYVKSFITSPNIMSFKGTNKSYIYKFVSNIGVSHQTYNRTIYVEYFKID